MTFKPNRLAKVLIWITFLVTITGVTWLIFAIYPALGASIPLSLFFLWICTNYCIAMGRTITFEPEGCYVEFLWFRKMYRWEDMKTRRYEKYSWLQLYPERRSPFTDGVFFSPRRTCKFTLVKAATRGAFTIFPFSHIYVYFYPAGEPSSPKWTIKHEYFAVSKSEFKEKMQQWHVSIEGLEDR